MINAYLTNSADLDDRAIHLLFSANRWEKTAEITRKLQAGVTLVVDRCVEVLDYWFASQLPIHMIHNT